MAARCHYPATSYAKKSLVVAIRHNGSNCTEILMKTILTICLLSLLTSVVSAQSYDFQGLHVGMTVAELNQLITDTKWGRSKIIASDPNQLFEGDDPILPFLTADDFDPKERPYPDNHFHRWINVNNAWLHWEDVFLFFRDAIVTDIRVSSRPIFEEDRRDLAQYADALLGTLTTHLGTPVKAVKPSQMQRTVDNVKATGRDHVTIGTWRWKYKGGDKHQLAQVKVYVDKFEDEYWLNLLISDHTSTTRY